MKKTLSIVVGLVLVTGAVFAGLEITGRDSFYTGGNAPAGATIDKGDGAIYSDHVMAFVETNKAINVYRPDISTTFSQTNSYNTTNITLYTTVSNKVAGYTLTASDSILVQNTLSSTNWLLAGIASVGATSTNSAGKIITTAYTLDSAIFASTNDVVYICKNANTLTVGGLPTNTVIDLEGLFTGFRNNPVHITLGTGAGATASVVGSVTYQK